MRWRFPLLAKELRALRPYLLLVLFIYCIDPIDVFLSDFPDLKPLRYAAWLDASDAWNPILNALLTAFPLAMGLLARERAEGTLAFLDSLPTTRLRIFAAKVAAALTVLWSGPVVAIVFTLLTGAMSRTSIDPSWHLQPIVRNLALQFLVIAAVFSIGLACSLLGRFGWVVLPCLLVGIHAATEHGHPLSVLDAHGLMVSSFEGMRATVEWERVAALAACCAVTAGLSFVAFVRAGRSRAVLAERLKRGWLVPGITTLLVCGTWLGLFFWLDENVLSESGKKAETFASFTESRARTDKHVIQYSSEHASRAEMIARESDAVHARVQEYLGADAIGTITVDASGTRVKSHAAGTAESLSIWLDVASSADDEDVLGTLGHEIAHVFVDDLTDGHFRQEHRWTRFFNEGLATHVGDRLFRSPERGERRRLAAAAAWKLGNMSVEDLFDDSRLRRTFDPYLAYGLGSIFVDTCVELRGESFPGQLLRAFARPELRGLSGPVLWRAAFQVVGLDFDEATATFVERVESYPGLADVSGIELPRHALEVKDGVIEVKPLCDPKVAYRHSVRLRASTGDTAEAFVNLRFRPDGTFRSALSEFPDGEFGVQVGRYDSNLRAVLWSRWTEYDRASY